tara:strand:- start:1768 stop:2505 length:738 start_codon:yes stop_codon:yes gene_type:complete
MILSFIAGSIIGSFLNVIISRTPQNQSIISPRSHCPKCKNFIPFYYNIPIVSFILLSGKCNQCKEKISWQYISVEIITGILFVFSFSKFSVGEAILLNIVFCCLIIISYIDFHYLLIPSIYLYLLIILLIPYSYITAQTPYQTMLGALVITSYLATCTLIVGIIKRDINVLGFGDILLIIFIGGWLGIIHSFISLFLAAIIGILYMIINNYLMKNETIKIPFGTCLSISFTIILILKEYTMLLTF